MKKKFTKIVLSFVVLTILLASKNYAATITATVSGNWSSASTWSGGTAGTTISFDNIVIPAGITVTLDQDVEVTNILGSISVSGNLNSSGNHKLMITSGSLSGNGDMNLYYLELGSVGGMSFSGDLTVNHFITSNLSLNLGSQVTLVDTMYLKSGSLTLGAGSLLMLNTSSNIKVEDGSMAISGGVFTATNAYNVMYVGSSKNTGIELSGSGMNNMYVQLSGANQNLTLGSDMAVNGTLHHHMGTLKLNGKKLTLKGDYMSTNGSLIAGSATSDLEIQSSGLSSNLMFASGSQMLNDLTLDMNSSSGTVILGNGLTINGQLNLEEGKINVSGSALKMGSGSTVRVNKGSMMLTSGGSFDGTASYNVLYEGSSKSGNQELTGTGLNNVTLNLNNAADSVKTTSDVTIDGMFTMTKGSLNLQGHHLNINGTISGTSKGYIQSYSTSNITINTTAGVGDTLNFHPQFNKVNNITVNTGNGSNLMIGGSDIQVENLTFTNGGITIYDNDITINSTGMISGYGANKYVTIKGDGELMMNVNTSSPYVTFPVGTTSSYAPVHIQRTSGANAVLGVNTRDGIWSMGTSGSNMASSLSVVNRSWNISSASTSSVNLNAKFEWASGLEVNGFDRNAAYVAQYTNNWDMVASGTSSVAGVGYQMARNNIVSPGTFAVVDNMSALSVKEQNGITFSVYPNPAHSHLTLKLNENEAYGLEVFDALGNSAIQKTTINGSSEVDLSSLTAGVYFVKITSGKEQSIKRIVKQ